jgi:hypothetical protein
MIIHTFLSSKYPSAMSPPKCCARIGLNSSVLSKSNCNFTPQINYAVYKYVEYIPEYGILS